MHCIFKRGSWTNNNSKKYTRCRFVLPSFPQSQSPACGAMRNARTDARTVYMCKAHSPESDIFKRRKDSVIWHGTRGSSADANFKCPEAIPQSRCLEVPSVIVTLPSFLEAGVLSAWAFYVALSASAPLIWIQQSRYFFVCTTVRVSWFLFWVLKHV